MLRSKYPHGKEYSPLEVLVGRADVQRLLRLRDCTAKKPLSRVLMDTLVWTTNTDQLPLSVMMAER